jgi:hypothetical protein
MFTCCIYSYKDPKIRYVGYTLYLLKTNNICALKFIFYIVKIDSKLYLIKKMVQNSNFL